ncbi:MAG: tetratricopeptide repeat protein [Fimbriimonadaceae bacterium]|nr:tetratricopeptide repeat protein [Fimbriimonadaceae bacterium]QYK59089.1 MAG: tetratricopeptide repeat protein [Fimbriimonadaceae bacterium]
MDPHPRLRLKLLGGFQAVRIEDGAAVKFANRKVAQLLAYLVRSPGDRHDRNRVAKAVWPDAASEAALSSLRNALTLLRKDLDQHGIPADEVLHADRVSLTVVPGTIETDLDELTKGRAGEALAIYTGPLAPEWDTGWAAEARARARAHVRAEACHADADEVVAAHSRDPEDEPLFQAAVSALLEEGQAARAVDIVRRFSRSLRKRAGHAPSETTAALARKARIMARAKSARPESNVPRPQTPLFGRDTELEEVTQALATPGVRVVTLVGTGGVGKTRLALDVAWRAKDTLRGAVWVVDLAASTDPAQVPRSVLSTVAPDSDASDARAALVEVLAFVPSLLVLDNLEQFGPGLRSVIDDLAEVLPLTQFLATSRTDPRIEGSRVVRLEHLALPSLIGDPLDCPSVALYVERARAVAPGFVLDDPLVLGELAKRLEGLPLAICLAAAQADVLSPAETLRQLDDRFALLQTETLPWPDRHRRLWACLDWSHRLVPESHRLLARLTPFRGGWTVETATPLCPDEPVPSRLQGLLRTCLIAESSRAGQVRFDMAESVREFIEAQMSPEEREQASAGHATAMLAWLQHPSRTQQTFNAGYLRDRTLEYENLRAAFDWCLEFDPSGALQVVNALAYYWLSREMAREGLEWIDRALARPEGLEPVSVAMAHRARSTMLIGLSRFHEAVDALEQALKILPDGTDPLTQARTLNSLGNALMRVERFDEALASFERAQGLCEVSGAAAVGLSMQGNAGLCLYLAGRLVEARKTTESVVDALRDGDNHDWLSYFLHNLGLIARAEGDDFEALQCFAEARDVAESVGNDPAGRGWLADAAVSAVRTGDLDRARAWIHQGARAVRLTKGSEQYAECVEAAAVLFESEGELDEAAALLAALVESGLSPQRSQADRSPRPAERLERLRQRLGPAFTLAAGRYRGLAFVELLEEVADATASSDSL